MTPFAIMMLQDGLTFVIVALLAWLYIHPALAAKPLARQLMPLLFVHAFRFVPLAIFLPGQVAPTFPGELASLIAYGDLASGLLALAAIVVWLTRPDIGRVATLIFSAASITDMSVVLFAALRAGVYNMELGFIYYIPAFYVPTLAVFQIMILTYLIKGWNTHATKSRTARA